MEGNLFLRGVMDEIAKAKTLAELRELRTKLLGKRSEITREM